MTDGRLVGRHMRFAWLEYEDPRDAIHFDRTFSSAALGWRNLLLDLPAAGAAKRKDPAHPDLDIRWLSDPGAPSVRGLVARPTGAHSDFLGQWLLNPGIVRKSASDARLTFGTDATDQADLVAISGHGASGAVFGEAMPGAQPGVKGNRFDAAALMAKNVKMEVSGRLKYVMVASCMNASIFAAPKWLPVLKKDKPLRGILGFSETYVGDAIGAAVMRRFGDLLRSDVLMTVLDAWRQANESLDQAWGAVLRQEARKDNLIRWVRGHLDELSPNGKVFHFDPSTFPTGVEVTGKPQDFSAIVDDSTFFSGGLLPGRRGHLVLFGTGDHRFRAGTKATVLFFYFRPGKPEMDLRTLLRFDPLLAKDGTPLLRELIDANPRKGPPNGHADGIEVTFTEELQRIELPFTVVPTAPDHYKPDPDGRGNHGYFWVMVFPNGASPSDFSKGFPNYEGGFHLRRKPLGPTRR